MRKRLHTRMRKSWPCHPVGGHRREPLTPKARWECNQRLFCVREHHPVLFFQKLLVEILGGFLLPTLWIFWNRRPLGCSRVLVQLGDSNPASVKEWAHLLTASKQRPGPSASPELCQPLRGVSGHFRPTDPMSSFCDPGGAW